MEDKTRVLVVEDQPVPRQLLTRILSRDGFEVRAAATAAEAIQIGESFLPHVLLTDWLLPDDANGLEVARRLLGAQPRLAIIFLTGLPADKLRPQVEEIGPCGFLEKPCDFDELLQAIRHCAAQQRDACLDGSGGED